MAFMEWTDEHKIGTRSFDRFHLVIASARVATFATVAFSLLAGAAAADDAPFLGTDPASVLSAGGHQVQQWLSWAGGHRGESYNAFEALTEYDYGLTDRFQLSATLAYDWDRTRPLGEPAAYTSLVGIQGEAIFILAATDKYPLGIALAVDPAYNPSSHGIALRLLLTKYFLGFEHVLNINFENAWDKDVAGRWQEGGAVEFNYGLGYALDKHWTVGLEIGNQFTFDRLVTSVNFKDAGTALYLGPTVEYDCEALIVTAGIQTQLPVASGGDVVNGYRTDAERWRAGLRLTRAL